MHQHHNFSTDQLRNSGVCALFSMIFLFLLTIPRSSIHVLLLLECTSVTTNKGGQKCVGREVVSTTKSASKAASSPSLPGAKRHHHQTCQPNQQVSSHLVTRRALVSTLSNCRCWSCHACTVACFLKKYIQV